MAVQNFLAGSNQLSAAKERQRKRQAAAQRAEAMKGLGSDILSSNTGKTDMGQFVGTAVQQNLVDNPVSAFGLLKMSPEQWATELNMRGLDNKDVRPYAEFATKWLGQLNYIKAAAQYRAKAAYAAKGGSGRGKYTKTKIDLNKIAPTVLAKIQKKFGLDILDNTGRLKKDTNIIRQLVQKGNIEDVSAMDEDVYNEIYNQIKTTHPEFQSKYATESLIKATEQIKNLLYSPNMISYGKYVSGRDIDSHREFQFNDFETYISKEAIYDVIENPIDETVKLVPDVEVIPEKKGWLWDTPEKKILKGVKRERSKNPDFDLSKDINTVNNSNNNGDDGRFSFELSGTKMPDINSPYTNEPLTPRKF